MGTTTKKKGEKDIQDVIAGINKIMKYEAVMLVDTKKVSNIDTFSSGAFSLDLALGIGGYPRGRQIELAGAYSVGKTHMAVAAMIEVQHIGGQVAFIDMESSIDLMRFKHLGLDTSKLIVSSPDYLEQALDVIAALIPNCDLIVLDSIGGSTPKAIFEGTAEDNTIGILAKKLTQEVPKIGRLLEKNGCSMIWINQKRDNIGTFPVADSDSTPGGNNLRHHQSIRLFAKKVKLLTQGTENIGHVIGIKVAKNKLGVPLKIAEIYFLYETGICNEWSVMLMGVDRGILTKSGSYIKDREGMTLGQGEYNAVLFLMDNQEYYNNLRDAVSKSLALPE